MKRRIHVMALAMFFSFSLGLLGSAAINSMMNTANGPANPIKKPLMIDTAVTILGDEKANVKQYVKEVAAGPYKNKTASRAEKASFSDVVRAVTSKMKNNAIVIQRGI